MTDASVHPHVAICVSRFARLFGEDGPGAVSVKDVLERQAVALLTEHAARDEACAVPLRGLKKLFMAEADAIVAAEVTLDDARDAIAIEHGFEGWEAVEAGCTARLDVPFEAAADAIADGRLDDLRALLDAEPGLAQKTSFYGHRSTLLHYVAANGIEMRRQRSPKNLTEIAGLLLERGSVVDALAGTYGGDVNQTTLGLLVTSGHPAEAGVQVDVVKLLLEHGAAANGLDGVGGPLRFALEFGHLDAARALVDGGARVDDLVAAAGMGLLDRIPALFEAADDDSRGRALVRAAQYGHAVLVQELLDRGGAVDVSPDRGVTALHEASYGGHVDVVERLLLAGADRAIRDTIHGAEASQWADVGGHTDLAERLRRQ